ncbi:MAG: outer membrane protein assembly factor BamD, partial [Marinobacter sp.]
DSYEDILDRGSFSGPPDELLYQMAKAHALTGQHQQSIQRLRQLVDLYPRSVLVPEARFRIAEAAYAAGGYQEAETGYRHLVDGEANQDLVSKARYMLGWSQFKQGAQAWNRAADSFMALLDQQLPDQVALDNPPESSLDRIEDSFRVLALMASRSGDAGTLASWFSGRSDAAWHHLVYDRLADLHALEGDYARAVAINAAFAKEQPDHPASAEFLAQSVALWQMAGDRERAREARADYVSRYHSAPEYRALSHSQQATWRGYARFLGDYHYSTATKLKAAGRSINAAKAWSSAAGYYEVLAPQSGSAGQWLHLAGDARLQAGNPEQAILNFRSAAYGAGYERAAESGWAAVTVLRSRLEQSPVRSSLTTLSEEEQRFSTAFPADQRLSGLRADLANRWYELADYDQALTYARATLTLAQARPEPRYAAWLVAARVRQHSGESGLEERAWRQALGLIEQDSSLESAPDESQRIREQLATAVYRQGEQAAARGDAPVAVAHFLRVSAVLPGSEVAIKARFDAANTLLKGAEWQAAINELNRFRAEFPNHPLAGEISEKLAYAYHESHQPLRAADELLRGAGQSSEPWPLKLRAAELYHQAGATADRNALYRQWLALAPLPESGAGHLQQQTLRQRLIESEPDAGQLRQTLVARETDSRWHSQQTLLWAGDAALVLGTEAAEDFARIALVHPLQTSLARKQRALELAQTYFLEAESFAGEATRSEVLYRRAELYRILAKDLMASQVPPELNALETLQYRMLLEEEAYPLEERAMALHSRNHGRIASHGFDAWIERSLQALADMHPGRYNRELRWMSWNMEQNDGV